MDNVCSANLETCSDALNAYNAKSGYKKISLSDEVEVRLFSVGRILK